MLTDVDKYISKFAETVGCSRDERSHYYQLWEKVVRVSDHIGNTSDGCFHIIVKPNGYLIHHPATGTINIVTYREVQEFIRSLKYLPVDRTSKQDVILCNDDTAHVLGVPIQAFTEGQMSSIKMMVKKVKNQ